MTGSRLVSNPETGKHQKATKFYNDGRDMLSMLQERKAPYLKRVGKNLVVPLDSYTQKIL